MQKDQTAAEVAGVRLTHPDKLLYPAMGVTKRQLADYFAGRAKAMLPHLAARPVSLVRCPDGRRKACFFQKHAGSGLPDGVERIPIEEKSGERKDYLLFNTRQALVACAQIGALELHLWGSRIDSIERPDRLILDLDPGEGVDFAAVKRAAFDLRDALEAVALPSWALLTGGKGIHLVVTLERRHDWAVVGTFAKDFAERIATQEPERFVATMAKAKRKGRIFIDHFRNRRGATAIAPYSPRAREGAPIAAPVSWEELTDIDRSDAFSLADAEDRIANRDKAWPGEAARRARLTKDRVAGIGLSLQEA